MVEVKKHFLEPTALIPNSPYPLLHYPGFFSEQIQEGENIAPLLHERFADNGWKTQWIFRYGQTQESHYHTQAHECMVVLSGNATIRFGVADSSSNLEESTHGTAFEKGGIEIPAQAGDVFVLPAGLAHKTFDTTPASFALLSPGKGHGIDADNPTEALAGVKLSGFTMIGAYPINNAEWDYATGGENADDYTKVWSVPKPEYDPVLGKSDDGLCQTWLDVAKIGPSHGQSRENFYNNTTVDVDFLK